MDNNNHPLFPDADDPVARDMVPDAPADATWLVDRMIAPDHSAQSSTYDNLRNMAVPQTGMHLPGFPGGAHGPANAPDQQVLLPLPRNRNGLGR